MAFPVVQSTSQNSLAGGSTHVISMPSGIQVGDLLLVFFGTDGDNTIIDSQTFTVLDQQSYGTTNFGAILYKIATGGDTLTITVSVTNEPSSHIVYRIDGWDSSELPELSTVAQGATANPNSTIVTPSWSQGDTLYIAVEINDRNRTVSLYPANYTGSQLGETGGGSGDCNVGVATRNYNNPSDDPDQWTLSATDQWNAWTIAVAPVGETTAYKDITLKTSLESALTYKDITLKTSLESIPIYKDITLKTSLSAAPILVYKDITLKTSLESIPIYKDITLKTTLESIPNYKDITLKTSFSAAPVACYPQTDSRLGFEDLGTSGWMDVCDADITDWDKADEFILATWAIEGNGDNKFFKMQWKESGGSFADVGADTEVCWGTDTDLIDQFTVLITSGCLTSTQSEENEGDNTAAIPMGASDVGELQWALGFGSGAQDGVTYEFQLVCVTDTTSEICSCSITTIAGETTAYKDITLKTSLESALTYKDITVKTTLESIPTYKDIALKTSLQSVLTYKDVALKTSLTEFVYVDYKDITLKTTLHSLDYKDITLKTSLESANIYKDITLKTSLTSSPSFKDIVLKTSFTSNNTYKDITLKTTLDSLDYKDVALKTTLNLLGYKDVALKISFELGEVQDYKDIALKTSFTSALTYKDITLKTTLDSLDYKDIVLKTSLESALTYKDIALKTTIESIPNYKDIALKISLISPPNYKDITLKTSLESAPTYKDISLKVSLESAITFKDISLKTTLDSLNYKDITLKTSLEGIGYKDIALKTSLRLSEIEGFKDITLKTSFTSVGFKDISIKVSLETIPSEIRDFISSITRTRDFISSITRTRDFITNN